MSNEVTYSREKITCFVDLLKNELPEHRDNRGKRHPLALVIAAFVLATLVGRQKLSSIHRFMRNRADWLHELVQTPKVKPISRAHRPFSDLAASWGDSGRPSLSCPAPGS